MGEQGTRHHDHHHGRRGGGGGGNPVYGLGAIGAGIWFWSRAGDDPQERAVAVLKAMVWPAFLVHDAFAALPERSGSRRKRR
jgi:hypothetical protein